MRGNARARTILTAVTILAAGCGGGASAPAEEARLVRLEAVGLELEPPFDPGVRSYRACPALLQTTVELRIQAEGAGHRVAVDGKLLAPDDEQAEVPLAPEATQVVVSILDDASRTLGDYTVLFDRRLVLERHFLKARYPGGNDNFGEEVAVSGDTLVVSARLEDGDGSPEDDDSRDAAGAVYVFVREEGAWRQQAYLKGDPIAEDEWFGSSVAISGDTIVVGAGKSDRFLLQPPGVVPDCGAAYVFVRSGGSWDLQARLQAQFGDTDDAFGISVAIDGDTLVVGADEEASDGSNPSDDSVFKAGAAYVYERDGSSWIPVAYLKADYPGYVDLFGYSVAVDGDTIVVGANAEDGDGSAESDDSVQRSGAVYVFVRDTAGWVRQAYLKADVPGEDDSFGVSVDLDGDTLVVGAYGEASDGSSPYDDSLERPGAVYVFERTGTTWSQESWLKAWNVDALDMFGARVAISGDSILVGATGEASDGTSWLENTSYGYGAAYLFVREGDAWVQGSYLKASNPDGGDFFGGSVAMSDGVVVVGADGERSDGSGPLDNSLPYAGAAYVFD